MPIIDYRDGQWHIYLPDIEHRFFDSLDEVQFLFKAYPFNKYGVTDEALNELLKSALG